MNNEMEDIKRLMGVTPELFGAFLREKRGAQFCVSCGSARLVVPEIDNQTYTASLQGNKHPVVSKKYVSYYKIEGSRKSTVDNCEYRVICLNCGFTSYYWAGAVVAWAERDLLSQQANKGTI